MSSRGLKPIGPKMLDLTGTATPDEEFHEEPQLEEPKVSEEIPNAVRLAIMRVHQKSGASQQGIALSRFANWRSLKNCDPSCE